MRIRRMLALGTACLLAAGLPATGMAQSGPTIQFLNPSGYTSATQRIVADKQDANGTFHLVAWAKGVTSAHVVEFELRPALGNPTTYDDEVQRVGTDTWEADVPLTGLQDGQYTLTARLFLGQAEVSNHELSVTVDAEGSIPSSRETVEITYPGNGGGAGYFAAPGKLPSFVVDVTASSGAERVRVLYSMSDPGNPPQWESCGAGNKGTTQAAAALQIRCTLKTGHAPDQVTALAAVANNTPAPGDPAPAADDAGDAHRVDPYAQIADVVDIDPRTTTRDPGGCQKISVVALDQVGRGIAGANVDVHASGPDDQLQFATIDTTPVTSETDPFQRPDRAHVSDEDALRCSDDRALGRQGDHNVPREDDVKHIESVEGTNLAGRWVFAIHSVSVGGTQVTAWVDSNDDDAVSASEATGGAQVGWGQPPPPPVREIFLSPGQSSATTGSCIPFEITARQGGSSFAGANVDVHLKGPDSFVTFCDTAGGSLRRAPNSGHTGETHEDGTRHAEGETDGNGRFVFGVTSPTAGQTAIEVWLDSSDDDVLSSEPSRTASATWRPPGERTISLSSSRSAVAKGRRVRLFGDISGDPACSGGQSVNIEAKPRRGGSFQTVRQVTTDPEGGFSTRVRMRATRRFRAVVSQVDPCQSAVSPVVTVRVR